MRYHVYSKKENETYPVALLVSSIRTKEIHDAYIKDTGLDEESVMVLDLHYSQVKKKTPVAEIKQYIEEQLLPVFSDWGTKYILVTDGDYFKVLAKAKKIDTNVGYVHDCIYPGYKVIYAPSYKAIFHDPIKTKDKIAQGVGALVSEMAGSYVPPGKNIIKFAHYPENLQEIEQALIYLLEMEKPLTIDIEAFDLKHPTAGIGTISFAWDKHSGIAFAVDYSPIPGAIAAPFGEQKFNAPVRALLKEFFIQLREKAIYHNIAFDVYNLIYQLYMDDILDTEGLLKGIDIMLRDWDDTKLITYLATNSCAGNKLGLKDQAQEFAGNYAVEEIVDICQIPLPKLLEYNLTDALSTWYVREKHYDTMVADQQLEVYEKLFKPAIVDIIQMQLTGMPIYMPQVVKVKHMLTAVLDSALQTIRNSKLIQEYEYNRLEKFTALKNATWKTKRATIHEILIAAQTSEAIRKEIVFNPNSGPQMQELLFDILGLPVISLTESKQPSVDRDTLEALSKHDNSPKVQEFLLAMLDYVAVNKLLTAFIPALENACPGKDGWHYLFGNFNLGGTLSGRLSSSKPNLQNIPANVMMKISEALLALLGDDVLPYVSKGMLSLGKLIKSCFIAPPGWLFCGLDFASLEDRISALTTKDPNKLKVYTGVVIYELTINGVSRFIRDDDTIMYAGKVMTGIEFYETYCIWR